MADDDDQNDQPDDAAEEQDSGADDQQDDDGDKELGPKGERALAAEKDKRRTAQAELREWKALGLSTAEIQKLVEERKEAELPEGMRRSERRKAEEVIRSEAKAEANAELMQYRVLDKIEAKAGKLFADPDDAAALLMKDHGADDFLDDGKIDVEAIEDALKGLLEKKPYLAAQGSRRFQGSADGGTRKESGKKQLNRDDLKRLSPQEIEKARKDGHLVDLLSGKT